MFVVAFMFFFVCTLISSADLFLKINEDTETEYDLTQCSSEELRFRLAHSATVSLMGICLKFLINVSLFPIRAVELLFVRLC